jgi:hypothetical protein
LLLTSKSMAVNIHLLFTVQHPAISRKNLKPALLSNQWSRTRSSGYRRPEACREPDWLQHSVGPQTHTLETTSHEMFQPPQLSTTGFCYHWTQKKSPFKRKVAAKVKTSICPTKDNMGQWKVYWRLEARNGHSLIRD